MIELDEDDDGCDGTCEICKSKSVLLLILAATFGSTVIILLLLLACYWFFKMAGTAKLFDLLIGVFLVFWGTPYVIYIMHWVTWCIIDSTPACIKMCTDRARFY